MDGDDPVRGRSGARPTEAAREVAARAHERLQRRELFSVEAPFFAHLVGGERELEELVQAHDHRSSFDRRDGRLRRGE